MSKWIVAGLIVLNLILGVGVYQRLVEQKATAQGIGRAVPQVATVAGQAGGNSVIYILDVNTGRMVALKNDIVSKRIDIIDTVDVAADLARIR